MEFWGQVSGPHVIFEGSLAQKLRYPRLYLSGDSSPGKKNGLIRWVLGPFMVLSWLFSSGPTVCSQKSPRWPTDSFMIVFLMVDPGPIRFEPAPNHNVLWFFSWTMSSEDDRANRPDTYLVWIFFAGSYLFFKHDRTHPVGNYYSGLQQKPFSILFHLLLFVGFSSRRTHIMADRAKGFLHTMTHSRIDEWRIHKPNQIKVAWQNATLLDKMHDKINGSGGVPTWFGALCRYAEFPGAQHACYTQTSPASVMNFLGCNIHMNLENSWNSTRQKNYSKILVATPNLRNQSHVFSWYLTLSNESNNWRQTKCFQFFPVCQL